MSTGGVHTVVPVSKLSMNIRIKVPEPNDVSAYLRLPHCILGMSYKVNETSVSQSN